MYSHYCSSIITTLSCLLCLCTILFSSVSAQQKKINLTPHEQRLFDALDNVNNDFNAFKACFARNARIEQHLNDVKNGKAVEKSGTFDDTLGNFESMKEYKIKWEPVTTTDANHPDLGMFAFKYWNYGLTEEGCEGLFSGLGIAQVSASLFCVSCHIDLFI
eukprot:981326_1